MKKNLSMICNVISFILVIAFAIKVIIDDIHYTTTLNSAPFYVWVLVDALFLILPAIVVFFIGFIVKKNNIKS